jgi:hypothetical protein
LPGGFDNFVKNKEKFKKKPFSYDDELDDYDTFGKEDNTPQYLPPLTKNVNGIDLISSF